MTGYSKESVPQATARKSRSSELVHQIFDGLNLRDSRLLLSCIPDMMARA